MKDRFITSLGVGISVFSVGALLYGRPEPSMAVTMLAALGFGAALVTWGLVSRKAASGH